MTTAGAKRALGRTATPTAAAVLAAATASLATSEGLFGILIAGGLLIASVPVIASALGSTRDTFEPVWLFALCYLILFVLQPLATVTADAVSGGQLGRSFQEGYNSALAIGLLGSSAYMLGYYIRANKKVEFAPSSTSLGFDVRRLTVSVVALVVVCLLLFSVYLQMNGGLGLLVQYANGRGPELRQALSSSSGYFYTAPLWLSGVPLLLLAKRGHLSLTRLVLAVGIGLLSLISSLGNGSRSYIIPVVLSFAIMIYLRWNKRPRVRSLLIVSTVAFVLLVTVPREYRDSAARTESLSQIIASAAQDPAAGVEDFLQGQDAAMVENLAILASGVPEQTDYAFGRTYVGAIARPVPRQVWPGQKPLAADTILNATFFPEYASRGIGFSYSIYGEPYFNFGVVGVGGVLFLFGFASRAFYDWFASRSDDMAAAALYAASLPFVVVYFRGGFGVDYQRQLFVVLPMLLIIRYSLVRRRAGSDASWN